MIGYFSKSKLICVTSICIDHGYLWTSRSYTQIVTYVDKVQSSAEAQFGEKAFFVVSPKLEITVNSDRFRCPRELAQPPASRQNFSRASGTQFPSRAILERDQAPCYKGTSIIKIAQDQDGNLGLYRKSIELTLDWIENIYVIPNKRVWGGYYYLWNQLYVLNAYQANWIWEKADPKIY